MGPNDNTDTLAKNRIDKGIVRTMHDSNAVPGPEMPNGILSMKPLEKVPTAVRQMGPNVLGMDPPARPNSR